MPAVSSSSSPSGGSARNAMNLVSGIAVGEPCLLTLMLGAHVQEPGCAELLQLCAGVGGEHGCIIRSHHSYLGLRRCSPARLSLHGCKVPGQRCFCAPSRTRTCGLLLRRQLLYPLSYRGRTLGGPAARVKVNGSHRASPKAAARTPRHQQATSRPPAVGWDEPMRRTSSTSLSLYADWPASSTATWTSGNAGDLGGRAWRQVLVLACRGL